MNGVWSRAPGAKKWTTVHDAKKAKDYPARGLFALQGKVYVGNNKAQVLRLGKSADVAGQCGEFTAPRSPSVDDKGRVWIANHHLFRSNDASTWERMLSPRDGGGPAICAVAAQRDVVVAVFEDASAAVSKDDGKSWNNVATVGGAVVGAWSAGGQVYLSTSLGSAHRLLAFVD
jgi:hypothetical protein